MNYLSKTGRKSVWGKQHLCNFELGILSVCGTHFPAEEMRFKCAFV